MYKLTLLPLLALALACSPQSRQMRQAKKYSKQNVKRQQSKTVNDVVVGASDELTRDDVNYKDLARIKAQCLHVGKDGKRCTRKCSAKSKYCFWHTSSSEY